MTRFRGFDGTIKVLRDRLFNLPYVQYVYLFGSVAKGKVHEDSDLDLLIIGNKEKTIEVLMELSKLCENDKVIVDTKYYFIDDFVKCLNSGNLFLQEIDRTGFDVKELDLDG